MNVAEVITEPMSVMDGARAAAVMVADQRLTPQIPDIGGDCDPGREWGDPDFTLEDASIAAFLGDGCEPFSRHQQMLGAEWNDDHMGAFTHGFITMARACLWPGGNGSIRYSICPNGFKDQGENQPSHILYVEQAKKKEDSDNDDKGGSAPF